MIKDDITDELNELEDDDDFIDTDELAEELDERGGDLSRLEKFRRLRSIRVSKVLFRAIDVVFNKPQNACPFVSKKSAKTIECVEDIIYDEAHKSVCAMDMYRVPPAVKPPP